MRRLCPPVESTGSSWAALAPMVDLLTILLVFLLKSWSTDPPVRPGDPDFSLPSSTSQNPVDSIRALDLTESGIFLAGARVSGTRYYLDQDVELIQELYDIFLTNPGRLQVRVDEEVPYKLIRKVLFTLREAGVTDITLVALSRDSL